MSSTSIEHGVDQLPFADINVPTEIVFNTYGTITAPTYYKWKSTEQVTFGLYTDVNCNTQFDTPDTAQSGNYNATYTYWFEDTDGGQTLYLGVKYNGQLMKSAALAIPERILLKDIGEDDGYVEGTAAIGSDASGLTVGLYNYYSGALIGQTTALSRGSINFSLEAPHLEISEWYYVHIKDGQGNIVTSEEVEVPPY
jgi:hypothetical protein